MTTFSTMTLKELEVAADSTSHEEILQDIIVELLDRNERAEAELARVRVDPQRNRALARSVQAFAEWHSSGYEGDTSTFAMLAKQLWHEVADHVRAVTGKAPHVAADTPQLGLFGEQNHAGARTPGSLQQALFG